MGDMDREATIFVVDDEDSWRNSIRNALEVAGFKTKVYSSAESFLSEYSSDQAGCLVLDVELPGMSGLELQQMLLQHEIQPPIVFVSSEPNVAASVKAMKAGAVDFLQKPFKDVELLARVQEAVDRDYYTRQRYQEACYVNDRIDSLTRREKEVMDLVLEGHTNKEIANILGLSHRTVELHRSRVMSKMKADSIVGLVKMTSTQQQGNKI
jgi:FixJ family two-component response regulator